MKKLLLLGGSRYLIPAIEVAHQLGIYVITADYLPDNSAHQFSDEYHNVSIVEQDAVFDLAKRLKVDGIMSFATDPGVAVAAYVADKLGLPTCPRASVALLQNKGEFRRFLRDNGFNVPTARTYRSAQQAAKEVQAFHWPVMVKPVDSAGSKGVSRVDDPVDLEKAAKLALQHSFTNEFIVEDFLEKSGFSTDTDSFSVNGKLVFCSFNDQHFDENAPNPYTPAAFTWPSTMPAWAQKELRSEIQRLLTLLGMTTSIYNIETRVCTNGKAYIMECSPRAGGNRLAEVLRLATGQDLIVAAVKAAVGMEVQELHEPKYNGFWGELILHSEKAGVFQGIDIDESIQDCIIEEDLWVKKGDAIEGFTGANASIGTVIIRAQNKEKLDFILLNSKDLIKVRVKN